MIPLDGEGDVEPSFEVSWRFTHGAGALLVKRHPDLLTQEFIKADRAGRIFVDTGRNGPGATCAAVYAVRPKPGAPVSAPCTWEEVDREAVVPRTFTLRTMPARIAAVGDLWAGIEGRRCSLGAALENAGRPADRRRLEGIDGRHDTPADLAQGDAQALVAPAPQGELGAGQPASMTTTCACILPSIAPRPKRRATASVAASVASPRREASRASISLRSGVP